MDNTPTKLTLDINGMHCDSCIQRIESALGKITGLPSIQVTLGQVVVTLDDSQTTKREIIESITQGGQFTVTAFSTERDTK